MMEIELWSIDRPVPYSKNPRKIPQSAIEKVAASIKEFGWRQPIVVEKYDESLVAALVAQPEVLFEKLRSRRDIGNGQIDMVEFHDWFSF